MKFLLKGLVPEEGDGPEVTERKTRAMRKLTTAIALSAVVILPLYLWWRVSQ